MESDSDHAYAAQLQQEEHGAAMMASASGKAVLLESNLPQIKTHGLLTKGDRSAQNVSSDKNHGSTFGDGIYTASNPTAFAYYGDVGLIVGRLQGKTVHIPKQLQRGTDVSSFNTVIGDKLAFSTNMNLDHSTGMPVDDHYNEVVLRTSKQVLPMIRYDKGLLDALRGKECIANMQKSLEKILGAFFNDSHHHFDSGMLPPSFATMNPTSKVSPSTSQPSTNNAPASFATGSRATASTNVPKSSRGIFGQSHVAKHKLLLLESKEMIERKTRDTCSNQKMPSNQPACSTSVPSSSTAPQAAAWSNSAAGAASKSALDAPGAKYNSSTETKNEPEKFCFGSGSHGPTGAAQSAPASSKDHFGSAPAEKMSTNATAPPKSPFASFGSTSGIMFGTTQSTHTVQAQSRFFPSTHPASAAKKSPLEAPASAKSPFETTLGNVASRNMFGSGQSSSAASAPTPFPPGASDAKKSPFEASVSVPASAQSPFESTPGNIAGAGFGPSSSQPFGTTPGAAGEGTSKTPFGVAPTSNVMAPFGASLETTASARSYFNSTSKGMSGSGLTRAPEPSPFTDTTSKSNFDQSRFGKASSAVEANKTSFESSTFAPTPAKFSYESKSDNGSTQFGAMQGMTMAHHSLGCSQLMNGGSIDGGRNIRDTLVSFYQTHNPSRMKDVDKILMKYSGKEDLLLENLAKKYNVHLSTLGVSALHPTSAVGAFPAPAAPVAPSPGGFGGLSGGFLSVGPSGIVGFGGSAVPSFGSHPSTLGAPSTLGTSVSQPGAAVPVPSFGSQTPLVTGNMQSFTRIGGGSSSNVFGASSTLGQSEGFGSLVSSLPAGGAFGGSSADTCLGSGAHSKSCSWPCCNSTASKMDHVKGGFPTASGREPSELAAIKEVSELACKATGKEKDNDNAKKPSSNDLKTVTSTQEQTAEIKTTTEALSSTAAFLKTALPYCNSPQFIMSMAIHVWASTVVHRTNGTHSVDSLSGAIIVHCALQLALHILNRPSVAKYEPRKKKNCLSSRLPVPALRRTLSDSQLCMALFAESDLLSTSVGNATALEGNRSEKGSRSAKGTLASLAKLNYPQNVTTHTANEPFYQTTHFIMSTTVHTLVSTAVLMIAGSYKMNSIIGAISGHCALKLALIALYQPWMSMSRSEESRKKVHLNATQPIKLPVPALRRTLSDSQLFGMTSRTLSNPLPSSAARSDRTLARAPFTIPSFKATSAIPISTLETTPYAATEVRDGFSNIFLQSITAMPEYQEKSFEELRLQEYLGQSKSFSRKSPVTTNNHGTNEIAACATNNHGTNEIVAIGGGTNSYTATAKEDFGSGMIILHSITAMPEYQQKSFEELRLEDYLAGNKGANSFMATPSSFSASQNGFMAPPSSFSVPQPCPEFFHSITALPPYNDTSFEELRLKDYSAGNIGTKATITYSAPSTTGGSVPASHQVAAPPTSVFSFGGPSPSSDDGGFSFGTKLTASQDGNSGCSFGCSCQGCAGNSTVGFSFGPTPGQNEHAISTGGFSFGSKPAEKKRGEHGLAAKSVKVASLASNGTTASASAANLFAKINLTSSSTMADSSANKAGLSKPYSKDSSQSTGSGCERFRFVSAEIDDKNKSSSENSSNAAIDSKEDGFSFGAKPVGEKSFVNPTSGKSDESKPHAKPGLPAISLAKEEDGKTSSVSFLASLSTLMKEDETSKKVSSVAPATLSQEQSMPKSVLKNPPLSSKGIPFPPMPAVAPKPLGTPKKVTLPVRSDTPKKPASVNLSLFAAYPPMAKVPPTSFASTQPANGAAMTSTGKGSEVRAEGLGSMLKVPEEGSWTCGVCMVTNKPSVSACAACDTPKPGEEDKRTTNSSAVNPSATSRITGAGGFTFGGGLSLPLGSNAKNSTGKVSSGFSFGGFVGTSTEKRSSDDTDRFGAKTAEKKTNGTVTTEENKQASSIHVFPPTTSGFGLPPKSKLGSSMAAAQSPFAAFSKKENDKAASSNGGKKSSTGFSFGGFSYGVPAEEKKDDSDTAKNVPSGGFGPSSRKRPTTGFSFGGFRSAAIEKKDGGFIFGAPKSTEAPAATSSGANGFLFTGSGAKPAEKKSGGSAAKGEKNAVNGALLVRPTLKAAPENACSGVTSSLSGKTSAAAPSTAAFPPTSSTATNLCPTKPSSFDEKAMVRRSPRIAKRSFAPQTLCYMAPWALTYGIPSDALTLPPLFCDLNEDCVVCHEVLSTDTCVALARCSHVYHSECIELAFKSKPQCPICRVAVGAPQGKSPSGEMRVELTSTSCSGFLVDSIEIVYDIPSAIQMSYHDNPGAMASGKYVTAYLPNDNEGRDLLKRLAYAFMHGLTFTVGTSVTTGRNNQCTWASIHHKTSTSGGVRRHGFPDADYLGNCNEELDTLNVPPATGLNYDGTEA